MKRKIKKIRKRVLIKLFKNNHMLKKRYITHDWYINQLNYTELKSIIRNRISIEKKKFCLNKIWLVMEIKN